jgi:hypothetical protein
MVSDGLKRKKSSFGNKIGFAEKVCIGSFVYFNISMIPEYS